MVRTSVEDPVDVSVDLDVDDNSLRAVVTKRHELEVDDLFVDIAVREGAGPRPSEVVDVVVEYIDGGRFDVDDEHGRAPLLASMRGRPSENTLRVWSYMATQPCLHTECPSSRSPHPIRTGSITWQHDIGLPESVVAERVDATVETIREHYDAATPRERLERRRRQHLDQLNVDDDPNPD